MVNTASFCAFTSQYEGLVASFQSAVRPEIPELVRAIEELL